MHPGSAQLESPPPNGGRAVWLGVIVALVLPTLITWLYFYQAAAAAGRVQQLVMAVVKVVQFALPIVWVRLVLHEPIAWRGASSRGVGVGVAFGLAVVASGWWVFRIFLEGHPALTGAVDQMRAKVSGFGLASAWQFVALGVFYSLVHSFLEEYYWRWFVFGQLRRLVSNWASIVVSSLGFTAHHVLVLSWYFGWWSWPTLLLSAAVTVGGLFWAWLYARSGSLYGPWLSHLLVDAGIFLIGYRLLGGLW